jgi:phosphonate transport system substrate-binding protein
MTTRREPVSRKIALLGCVLLLVAASFAAASPQAEKLGSEKNPIVWAFVPSGETSKVSAGAQSVADLLHAKTGLFFKTFVATDYVGVIEAMKANPPKAQMASLATAAYILAADEKVAEAALVSVRNGSAFYKGMIITRADTGIKTLADLKGKTFARVDPLSTSGWIIPSLMLKAAGLNVDTDMKVLDAGSHPGVVTAVYTGQADAGACFVDARTLIAKDHGDVMDKVIVLEESGNIPNDGVQFSPSVAKDLQGQIVDGLLAIMTTPEGKAAINTAYQWTALEKHDDSFYDSFRQVLQAAGVTADVMMPKKK